MAQATLSKVLPTNLRTAGPPVPSLLSQQTLPSSFYKAGPWQSPGLTE